MKTSILLARSAILLLLCLPFAAQDKKSGWPLTLRIESSDLTDFSGGNAEAARQADEMGAASPIMILFRGTLDGESHWVFECERENSHGEKNPCTELPHTQYQARWMHHRQILQFLVDGANGVELRYLNVLPNPKDPPPPNDAVLASNSYDFPVTKPSDRQNTEYPLLVHVYGASRLRISKGYVLLDAKVDGQDYGMVSCDAKTRIGICSVLDPGFYAARWTDDRKSGIALLATIKGEAHEFGYSISQR